MSQLFVGMISGTSMDGIDAMLARVDETSFETIATHDGEIPADTLQRLNSVIAEPERADVMTIGALDIELGRIFGETALQLIAKANFETSEIAAIGSHGQNVMHQPDLANAFSMQLGNPATIAHHTGIRVIGNFRNGDIALGGQGAPLAPGFHRWHFGDADEDRAVVNIGGISNVTLMFANGETVGCDTGPGNTLLDYWHQKQQRGRFDEAGRWASGGTISTELLDVFSNDDYFQRSAPKSTGREHFNETWLNHALQQVQTPLVPQDVQATLSELTAWCIAGGLEPMNHIKTLAVCGGGAHNLDLMRRIEAHLPDCDVCTTSAWGIDPDWVEAAAFAWLAHQRLHELPSNLPGVTGASAPISLGGLYLPPDPSDI